MDDLEDRIAARLHEALDRLAAGGFEAGGDQRGLVDKGEEMSGEEPEIRLSIEDVARIAAQVARESGVNGG